VERDDNMIKGRFVDWSFKSCGQSTSFQTSRI